MLITKITRSPQSFERAAEQALAYIASLRRAPDSRPTPSRQRRVSSRARHAHRRPREAGRNGEPQAGDRGRLGGPSC
jgi:hypothetical protein